MRKFLSIILIVLISFLFISCSNNSASDNAKAEGITDNVSNQESDSEKSEKDDSNKSLENSDIKTITKLYISYNGIKMDISTDPNKIAELEDAEKGAYVPDTNIGSVLADIIAVYDDGSESTYGTICVGADGAYYLKFASGENKGKVYKMADSSFTKGLF